MGSKRLKAVVLAGTRPFPCADPEAVRALSKELPEGSCVRDALRLVRCGPLKARLLLVSVNGERSSLDRELHEGDVLGFFFPVSGG